MLNKLTIISQYFPPENGAASERMKSFAEYLSQYFNLKVITSIPQHMLLEDETELDEFPFEVERLGLKRKPSNGKYQRLMYEVSFAFKVGALLANKRDDSTLLFTTPSPFLAIVALALKKIKMREYILDIRDLYPEVIVDAGILSRRNPIYRLAEYIMKLAYKNASILTYVNRKWSPQMQAVNPRALFLPNGISTKNAHPNLIDDREDLIVYSGNYGRMYDFDPILELAERFKYHKDERLSKTGFMLIGDGIQASYIKTQIEERQLGNVKMVGPFRQNKVRPILQRAKIGIVSLNLEADSLKGAVPNKLFDYLEAGLRTIAIIPETLSPEILSTGLISIHTSIDYDSLVGEVSESILNYSYKEITRESYPFLYRDHYLEKLLLEIDR